ncbi:MAG: HAD family hydrolase [Microbacterium sp.]
MTGDTAAGFRSPAGSVRVAAERSLVALDVDGTVILEDETLSPGIVEAIAHARRAGHEVMLATGRSWEGTRGIQHVLALSPEYAVCSNGAVIMKRVEGAGEESLYERFHVETFDPAEVLTLLRTHLPAARYMVELADGERLYTEYLDNWNMTHARRVSFTELTRHPVCRIVVNSPDDTADDFTELAVRIGLNKVSYAIGWSAWLDIAPQGVDKSTALERVRTWLGIGPERVLVMGDGRNDLGMLRWALGNGGRAIAMAQGPDEVRAAAGEVTASVAAGGAAAVLRRL